MATLSPSRLFELLAPGPVASGKALSARHSGTRSSTTLPSAQLQFLDDVGRRTNTKDDVPVHPEDRSRLLGDRRDRGADLSPVELAWLQRLPIEPTDITFDDAVRLAELARTVSEMKTPASFRLIESIWGPVRELHDERVARAKLKIAQRPIAPLPKSTKDAIEAYLVERSPETSPRALGYEADEIIDEYRKQQKAEHARNLERAEKALQTVLAARAKRASLTSEVAS